MFVVAFPSHEMQWPYSHFSVNTPSLWEMDVT